MTPPNPYEQRFFDAMSRRFDTLEENQEQMKESIQEIKEKVVYMYGFAAAVGLFGSFIVDFIRVKILNN